MTRAGLWIPLVIATLAGGCGEGSSSSPAAAPPAVETRPENSADVAIEITTPQVRTRNGILETSGKVQFNEEAVTRVHSPVTGRVVEVLAKPGDVVEAGHALFTLDSPDLGQAKSDYVKAISDVERADKALRLIPDNLQLPYPPLDLFWALFRRE